MRGAAALALLLAAGCAIPRDHGPAPGTMWAHLPGEGSGSSVFFAARWHRYDPYREAFPLPHVGGAGDVLLFATRTSTSGSLLGGHACLFEFRPGDLVGYAPTGRVADPGRRSGREWKEYRLLGGPRESAHVADAVAARCDGWRPEPLATSPGR